MTDQQQPCQQEQQPRPSLRSSISQTNSQEEATTTGSGGDSPGKSKKSVRFLPDYNGLCVYYYGDAVMDQILNNCECKIEDIWYEYADLQKAKRKAMMLSKEAYKYGFGSLLTNTYENCNRDDSTQEALNTWTSNANSRRGLERWINHEYAAKRSEIRRRTISSVLRAQEKMRLEGISENIEYSIKVIARLSEAFSHDSRTFAHRLGIADEYAAKNCYTSTSLKQHSEPLLSVPSPPIYNFDKTDIVKTSSLPIFSLSEEKSCSSGNTSTVASTATTATTATAATTATTSAISSSSASITSSSAGETHCSRSSSSTLPPLKQRSMSVVDASNKLMKMNIQSTKSFPITAQSRTSMMMATTTSLPPRRTFTTTSNTDAVDLRNFV